MAGVIPPAGPAAIGKAIAGRSVGRASSPSTAATRPSSSGGTSGSMSGAWYDPAVGGGEVMERDVEGALDDPGRGGDRHGHPLRRGRERPGCRGRSAHAATRARSSSPSPNRRPMASASRNGGTPAMLDRRRPARRPPSPPGPGMPGRARTSRRGRAGVRPTSPTGDGVGAASGAPAAGRLRVGRRRPGSPGLVHDRHSDDEGGDSDRRDGSPGAATHAAHQTGPQRKVLRLSSARPRTKYCCQVPWAVDSGIPHDEDDGHGRPSVARGQRG